MTRAWLIVALSLFAGCLRPSPRRAYVLHLNAGHPAQSTLCRIDEAARDAKAPAVETDCRAWTGDSLSPGAVSIDVSERTEGTSYDVHVSSTVREAAPADVKAVLDGVADRVLTGLRDTVARGEASDPPVMDRLLDAGAALAPKLTSALRDHLADEEKQPLPSSEIMFKNYLKGDKTLATPDESRAAGVFVDYNLDKHSPPPRSYRLTDANLKYLADQGVPDADVKAWVVSWCTAASFQHADRAAPYAALAQPPDPKAFNDALQISAADLGEILIGRSPSAPLEARLEALIDEVKTKAWTDVSPAGKAYFLMRIGTGVGFQADNCVANLAAVGATPEPALLKLQADARKHADALVSVLGPLVAGGLERAEHIVVAEANAEGQFGIFELAPGSVAVELGATRANQRQPVATYRADILGMERFALVVGPMLTVCRTKWRCFDTYGEDGPDEGRQIVRNKDRTDVSIATALHVSLVSGPKLAVGLVVGYPVGTPSSTSYNVIAGLGLRFSQGAELTVGVHAFKTAVLRDAYDKINPITVTDGLTVDSVTREAWRGGVFVMLGLDPSLFSKLK